MQYTNIQKLCLSLPCTYLHFTRIFCQPVLVNYPFCMVFFIIFFFLSKYKQRNIEIKYHLINRCSVFEGSEVAHLVGVTLPPEMWGKFKNTFPESCDICTKSPPLVEFFVTPLPNKSRMRATGVVKLCRYQLSLMSCRPFSIIPRTKKRNTAVDRSNEISVFQLLSITIDRILWSLCACVIHRLIILGTITATNNNHRNNTNKTFLW